MLKLFMWNQEGGALGGTKGGDQAPGAGAPSMSCRMVGPGGANLGLRGALVPRPGKEGGSVGPGGSRGRAGLSQALSFGSEQKGTFLQAAPTPQGHL